MPEPDRCLLLFTKPARPGRVKTRLTRGEGALTPERAARLHAAFLGDLAERLLPATRRAEDAEGGAAGAALRLRVAWALEDREEDPRPDGGGAGHDAGTPPAPAGIGEGELGALVGVRRERGSRLPTLEREVGEEPGAPDRWRLEIPSDAHVDGVRQSGATLGHRLYGALAAAAQDHPGGVAAVGSDHPTLPRERVLAAFDALADADVVLGPADDGGYYLVALRPAAVRRELFEGIAWSTASVLAATEERCRRLGLSVARLPEGRDVDEPADLRDLAAFLAGRPDARSYAGESRDCPRTRYLLATWNRLPTTVSSHEKP